MLDHEKAYKSLVDLLEVTIRQAAYDDGHADGYSVGYAAGEAAAKLSQERHIGRCTERVA